MLNGRQIERIRNALVEAFTLDELEALVRINLDTRLERVVATGKPLDTVALELVEWADKNALAAVLLAAAVNERPRDSALRLLAQEVAALPAGAAASDQMQRIDRGYQLHRAPQSEVDVATTLLAWLIDRFHQTLALEETIRRAQALSTPRPILFLLHGNEDECHDKFIERIVRYELGNWLPQLAVPQKFLMKMLAEKPKSTSDLHDYLRGSLGHNTLGTTTATAADINSRLASLRAPAVIHSLLGIGGWGQDERSLVHEYLAFWNRWPDLAGTQLLLSFLCIRIQPTLWSKLTARLRRQDDDLDTALDEFNTFSGTGSSWNRIICKPLPALAPISRQEAAEWASTPKVQDLFAGRDLVSEIDKIYAAQRVEALPMATLHHLLEATLQLPAAPKASA